MWHGFSIRFKAYRRGRSTGTECDSVPLSVADAILSGVTSELLREDQRPRHFSALKGGVGFVDS